MKLGNSQTRKKLSMLNQLPAAYPEQDISNLSVSIDVVS